MPARTGDRRDRGAARLTSMSMEYGKLSGAVDSVSEVETMMSSMEHFSIVKALARAALADGSNREVVTHQLKRLEAALRKAGDSDADPLQKILHSASHAARAAPSRVTRSIASDTEQMTSSVPVPMDPDSSAPLATVIFPAENLATKPVFNERVTEVIQSLTMEWEHQDQLLEAGLRPSLTALAYGAPGTGKTTLALWFAKQLQLPAVVVRLDGLISSLLGTTARNLGALFAFANRYECVLILDEFDAIAKLRDDPNEVGEIKRVVNALLQNMDTRAGRGITIGLTNHEALLDPAVWRRFEVQVPIPLPGAEERQTIVATALRSSKEWEAEARLIVWITAGLSGAEVTTVCDKWRKRRVLDADAAISPADVIVQIASTTAARYGAVELAGFIDRDELLVALARSAEVHFTHAELAHLFGISTKTVSRRMNELQSEVVHA